MADAFQSYINMVTGVTKSTQAKAAATARALLKQAGLEDVATEASERVTKLAEEIMNASRTNRELIAALRDGRGRQGGGAARLRASRRGPGAAR